MPKRKPKLVIDANGQAWVPGPDPTPLDLSPSQIAAAMGRLGGLAKSRRKTAAARANAKLPRGPRKNAT